MTHIFSSVKDTAIMKCKIFLKIERQVSVFSRCLVLLCCELVAF